MGRTSGNEWIARETGNQEHKWDCRHSCNARQSKSKVMSKQIPGERNTLGFLLGRNMRSGIRDPWSTGNLSLGSIAAVEETGLVQYGD